MEFGFDPILSLNWLTKIMFRAIPNDHAGHIWPVGSRFPTPAVNDNILIKKLDQNYGLNGTALHLSTSVVHI